MFIELTTLKYQNKQYTPFKRMLFNLEDIRNIKSIPETGAGASILCDTNEGVVDIWVAETYEYITTVLRTTGNALMLRENNENTK